MMETERPEPESSKGWFRAPMSLQRTPTGREDQDAAAIKEDAEDVPLSIDDAERDRSNSFEMPTPLHSKLQDDDLMRELTQTPRPTTADGVLTVDEWLVTAGGFGKFQYRQTLLVGFLAYGMAGAFWVCQPIFINPKIQEDLGASDAVLSATSSLTFAGWAIGAFIWTRLADTYGRKPIVFTACASSACLSLLAAASPHVAMYAVCRFLLGGCLGGMGATAYILMIEFLSPDARGPVTNIANLFFAVGTIILAIVAWMVQAASWRVELVIDCLPAFLFLCSYQFVHESPRWLVVTGQVEKAEMVLGVVARMNGALMDQAFCLERSPQDPVLSPRHTPKHADAPKEKQPDDGFVQSVKRLLRPSLRKQGFVLFFCWFAVTFVYYGLTMAAGSMPGSVYVNTILLALVELPAYLAFYYSLEMPTIGRKKSQAAGFVFSGIALILIMVFNMAGASEFLMTGLALIGKLGVAGAFLTVYVFAGELFPTSVRGVGLGCCNIFARIGGVLGPLAPLMGPMPLVFLMFGVLAFGAGVITSLYLSETLGKPLKDLMDEDTPAAGHEAGHFELELDDLVELPTPTNAL